MFSWLKSLFASESEPNIETALAYFRRGDFPKALECADKIIASSPEVALSWRFKAECLGELERYDQAVDCYRKALELGGPGTEDLLNNIALMQFCAGNKSAALATLAAVIQSDAPAEIKQQAQEMTKQFETL